MTNTAILAATKTKFLFVFTSIFIYLSPIHVILFLIGLAVSLDTLAGRWCAKHLAKRAKKDVRLVVTSKKTRQGLVSKMLTYQIAIISLFILDKYVLNDIINYFMSNFTVDFIITKFMGIVFLWIEFDSFDEKYYLVKGKRLKTIIGEKIKSIKRLIFSVKKLGNENQN
tara:strand:- start:808 stop:1314 length:507 start_codon:yes stop_codon:yes gene_type:complete